MKIVDLHDIDPEELRAIYRETTAGVPFCYPPSTHEFKDGLFAPVEHICNQKLVLSEWDNALVGFAHIALAKQEAASETSGLIRFLGYRRGFRRLAQSMLDAAEGYLFDAGATYIDIPAHNYSFYRFDFGPLSDKMAHVCALLGANGYEPTGSWLLMELPEYRIEKPMVPDSVEVVVKPEDTPHECPGSTIQLLRNGLELGMCEALPAHRFHTDQSAQGTFYIGWMEIVEGERGTGLGRLLLETTLWEMHKRGYSKAVLHTNCGNRRAQLLYANLGFQVLDTSYEFRKSRT